MRIDTRPVIMWLRVDAQTIERTLNNSSNNKMFYRASVYQFIFRVYSTTLVSRSLNTRLIGNLLYFHNSPLILDLEVFT